MPAPTTWPDPAAAPAVVLQDAKDHLQITGGQHDAELQRFLDAALTRLSHDVGPLRPTVLTERHDGGGTELVLRRRPVLEVLAVTEARGLVVAPVDADPDDLTAGVLSRAHGRFLGGRRAVHVTYRAGHVPLPEDLRQGVLELVRHLWSTQRGSGAAGARPGMLPDGSTAGAGYLLPNRVSELIEPYRLSVIG